MLMLEVSDILYLTALVNQKMAMATPSSLVLVVLVLLVVGGRRASGGGVGGVCALRCLSGSRHPQTKRDIFQSETKS